jgi:hypothetical protein
VNAPPPWPGAAAVFHGHDLWGNPVTLQHAQSLAAIDAFAHGFASSRLTVLDVLSVASHDASPLVQALCGLLHLFAEDASARRQAAPFIAQAEAAATQASPREQALVAAITAWSRGHDRSACAMLRASVQQHPRDLVAVKLAQIIHFNAGQLTDMLGVALASGHAAADLPWWHGMLAWGYEECHLLRDAEKHARQALALAEDGTEPWAQHALAHVLLTEGRFGEGADLLHHAQAGWVNLNSFMLTHNEWHAALFAIEQGDLDAALAQYDQRVWGVSPGYSQDQVNAISLLSRIELAGGDVGGRWQALRPWIEPRTADHVLPFLDLHYLYALARTEPEDSSQIGLDRTHLECKLLSNMQQHAAHGTTPAVWHRVAVPAAEALLAHAQGRWTEAADGLSAVLPHLQAIGGSHAQRDWFTQLLIDAQLHAGRWGDAQSLIEPQRRATPQSVRLQHLARRVYGGLGWAMA